MLLATEKLIANIECEFANVEGPPCITLSVARGIDDHKYNALRSLAREQKHHKHWKDVSKEEIDKYHDTWNFMDCEALRFYLPAFMLNALKSASDGSQCIEPAWMATGFYNAQAERVACFTRGQKRCMWSFLEIIHSAKLHPQDRDYFYGKIMGPWRDLLVEPGAPPNVGPTMRFSNSGAGGGPPSVS